ncbi:hypothetical protein Gogos_000070 [Gossypium gossypioides]|uniref:Uncharacterized protein n=1 Tax=Gossypium gossypioides TaxID=34282 RepID=A0A7J9CZ68_GOSGO|nr:hypothetical protein [Gossypium gossypioides]
MLIMRFQIYLTGLTKGSRLSR